MSDIRTRMYKHGSMTSKALSLLPSYREFRKTYKFLKKSQWWSREQLEEYQLEQLSKLLHHAYENVPYYRRVFNERGLKPDDIQRLDDLQKIPFLTKDVARKNLDDLKARNYPEDKFEYVTTSGTTSGAISPFGFYYEKGVSRAREWAYMKNQWDRVGYHFKDKCVVLRGYVSKSPETGKFFEYSLFGRWLILSPFIMSDENLPKYIEKIRRFNPKFIQAFPSEIILLAKFIKENNIEPFNPMKALLLGSENLYSWQRELLEEVFQCRVYSWYGHSEQAVLGGECEVSTNYHIFPQYGIIELVDSNGREISTENKLGEIIATGLSNFVMPFIRYRTMDLGMFSNHKCDCGRNYPLLQKIEGRLQEMIVGADKRLISLSALLAVIKRLEGYPQLKKVQFIQEKGGELEIKIIKGITYTDADERDILENINKNFGDNLSVKIKYVNHIPRTKIGKHISLIQKLPVELGDYNE